MKKTIITIVAAGMLVLSVGCQKEQTIVADPSGVEFEINVKRSDLGQPTKAVKTGWENGDKVYVFFDGNRSSADYMMTMTYNGSAWTYSPGSEVVANLQPSGTLSAIYCTVATDISFSTNAYFTLPQNGAGGFFMANNVAYTYSENKLKASLTLSVNDDYTTAQISISGISGDGWYLQEAGSSLLLSYDGVYYTGFGWNPNGNSGWGGKHYLTSYGGDLQTFVMVSYYARNARSWKFNLSNGTATYQKSFSSKSLQQGTAAKFAGPDDLDAPTNGWARLFPGSFTAPGTISDEDF
ncbi:MAG: hypothetical protein IKZ71_03935 [Bacteroidales bacterium]|nr:hypothetical protein [Bacteroidales bacterium]